MYNKVECICLTCDNCGETYTDEHSGFSIYVDENGAHEAADSDGWYLTVYNQYCPDCHTIDDGDNLVIDESRKVGIPQVVFHPKGSAKKVFNEFWEEAKKDTCDRKTLASIAFDAGHALRHEEYERTEQSRSQKEFTMNDFFDGVRGITLDARDWWDRLCSTKENERLIAKHQIAHPLTDEKIVIMYIEETGPSTKEN